MPRKDCSCGYPSLFLRLATRVWLSKAGLLSAMGRNSELIVFLPVERSSSHKGQRRVSVERLDALVPGRYTSWRETWKRLVDGHVGGGPHLHGSMMINRWLSVGGTSHAPSRPFRRCCSDGRRMRNYLARSCSWTCSGKGANGGQTGDAEFGCCGRYRSCFADLAGHAAWR